MTLDRKLASCLTAFCSSVHTWTWWSRWSFFKRQGTNFTAIHLMFSSSARMRWHDPYDSPAWLQTSWIVCLLSSRITSRTFAIISGVVQVDGQPECLSSSTDSQPSLKCLNHHMFLLGLKLAHQRPPSASVGFSCSFVELETKFNINSSLLIIRHFDISRHTWKRCKESSQNLETHALIKTPVGHWQLKDTARGT